MSYQVDPESRFEEMVAKLKAHNYRLTPQRIALLKLLAYSEEHPSVLQLYEQLREQFPTTSLATVYKTLHTLKELGEVLEVGSDGNGSRYDGRQPKPHPHLICVQCGRIFDAPVQPTEELIQDIVAASGFRVLGYRIELYGLCPDCQKAARDSD